MVWQHLVRNYLRRAAAEKLREAVVEAAQGDAQRDDTTAQGDDDLQKEGDPQREQESTPRVCHAAIIFASHAEAGSLLDRLQGVIQLKGEGFVAHEGGLAGRRVVVIQAAGSAVAAAATSAAIKGHQPRWVIAAGFASGLKSPLRRGDIVMADSVGDLSGPRLSIDLQIDSETLEKTPRLHVGRVLQSEQFARTSEAKRALASKHDAIALDNESFSVANACRDCTTRCLVIRVLRDTVEDAIPADIQQMFDQPSIAGKLGAATGALFRRPSSARDYFELKADALKAADRLAKFLASTIKQLEPPGTATAANSSP